MAEMSVIFWRYHFRGASQPLGTTSGSVSQRGATLLQGDCIFIFSWKVKSDCSVSVSHRTEKVG